MKFTANSIIDMICRELLNRHSMLVMLTKDGIPIDRSKKIANADAAVVDGKLELPLAGDRSIAEMEAQWSEILGCEVEFVEPLPAPEAPISDLANAYFLDSDSKDHISVSPKAHFSRFRREFRKATGLGVEIIQAEGKSLEPDQPLSAAGAKTGSVKIAPDMLCSEIQQQMRSLGLEAQVFTLNTFVDKTLSFGDMMPDADMKTSPAEGGSLDDFEALQSAMDSLGIPQPNTPAFSEHRPFPTFHRIDQQAEELVSLCETSNSQRADLESAVNTCLDQCSDGGQLWKVDTLLALMEAKALFLSLSKERDEILADISESFPDVESAKESLVNLIEEANSRDEIFQTPVLDNFMSIFCYAVNKAIEENDEEMLDEWIKGFGYGNFFQTDDGDCVWDIMEGLEMQHREEVVPAFMSFLKFNFGADVLPEGGLRDEFGDTDWDATVTHIVESCF